MITLIWIGISMSFFGGTLMLAKQKRSTSDLILTIWLFTLSFDFLLRAVEFYLYEKVLISNSFLLFNPILYFYIKSLIRSDFRFRLNYIFHFLPYVFLQVIIHSTKTLLTLDSFILNKVSEFVFYGFSGVSLLSWIIYISLSIKLLFKHDEFLEQEFSYKNRFNNAVWLKFVSYFYLAYSIIILLVGIYFIHNKIESSILVIIVCVVSLFLVYSFSFFGLLQKPIFVAENVADKHQSEKTSIPKLQLETTIEQITEYFENERPYLDPEFNMNVFADKMEMPKHKLTWILNNEIGKNFFLFVNYYRVEDAKKNLADKNNVYSIEAIGYDCGYNSKSSFFTNFKKITGLTPLQYKKTIGL